MQCSGKQKMVRKEVVGGTFKQTETVRHSSARMQLLLSFHHVDQGERQTISNFENWKFILGDE